jgi:hypothetical protein
LQKENGSFFLSFDSFCRSPSTKLIDSSWKLGSVTRAFATSGTLLTVTETQEATLSQKHPK